MKQFKQEAGSGLLHATVAVQFTNVNSAAWIFLAADIPRSSLSRARPSLQITCSRAISVQKLVIDCFNDLSNLAKCCSGSHGQSTVIVPPSLSRSLRCGWVSGGIDVVHRSERQQCGILRVAEPLSRHDTCEVLSTLRCCGRWRAPPCQAQVVNLSYMPRKRAVRCT